MRGYLRFDLTDNCNIRCIMCQAYNDTPTSAVNWTDFETFVKATKGNLDKWGTVQLGNVAEPSINPDFAKFLRFIRSETSATIHVVTNGSLLRRYADVINEVGNCLIQVSMDSISSKTHEYIRVGSKYDNVVPSINRIDLKNNRVLLSFTLMNCNVEEYPDMVEFCSSRGFLVSAFPMILRDNRGVIPLQLIKESLWFNKQGLEFWIKAHYGNNYDNTVIGNATGNLKDLVNEFSCQAHKTDLIVDAHGDAVLCGKVSLGNIYSSGLENVWSSNPANTFRLAVDANRAPCMDCDYFKRCLRPSLTILDNHFSENIAHCLDEKTRASISFERRISDADAMNIFIQAISKDFGIYRFTDVEDGFEARRVYGVDNLGEPLKAKSKHELQNKIIGQINSPFDCKLMEEGFHGYNIVNYLGRSWALPQALGRLNITRQEDRQKPGVLVADTVDELKALLLKRFRDAGLRPVVNAQASVLLVGAYKGYNLVNYDHYVLAVPISLGPLDLRRSEDFGRSGILSAITEDELRKSIDQETCPSQAKM